MKNAKNFALLMFKRRNIRLEAYTRRENIKFFNIKEDEATLDVDSTKSVAHDVLRD